MNLRLDWEGAASRVLAGQRHTDDRMPFLNGFTILLNSYSSIVLTILVTCQTTDLL